MRRALPLLSILLLAPFAQAWNVTGHEIVAAIAYDDLKANHPKTLAKIITILKAHPLPEMIGNQVKRLDAPAGQQDKALFMTAARFPDDVRMKAGIKGYSHPTWHYVDFPLSRKGDSTTGPQPDQPNALSALAGQLTVLSGDNPDKDKAVAVCWVAHLVGDLHQPLHAVSMYAKDLPKAGDRGGNDTYVRFGTKKTIRLHSLWDGLLGTDYEFKPASAIATELEHRPDFAPDKLSEASELDAKAWAKASFDIARKVAYLDATLPAADEKNGTVLPDTYGKDAKAVAERQVVLAGRRLSAVLANAID
ncbi:MAG: S1/P1 nuclease [Tepidisphaeraceae bacterium]